MRLVAPSASANISSQRAALSFKDALAIWGVECARLSCGGTLMCGAVSRSHLVRTLCMWLKMAAMGRVLPGGLAFQMVEGRCSIRIWFMRSLAAKIRTADVFTKSSYVLDCPERNEQKDMGCCSRVCGVVRGCN